MDLADVCFDIVEAIPHPYKFTFADQLIPAGISIPSNIAEGSRRPTKAYLNHLSVLARLAWRGRNALRSYPPAQACAGSASEQRICPHRADWKNAARARGIIRGAPERERVTPVTLLIPNPKSLIPQDWRQRTVGGRVGACLRCMQRSSRRAAFRLCLRKLLAIYSSDHPADLRQMWRPARPSRPNPQSLIPNPCVRSAALVTAQSGARVRLASTKAHFARSFTR